MIFNTAVALFSPANYRSVMVKKEAANSRQETTHIMKWGKKAAKKMVKKHATNCCKKCLQIGVKMPTICCKKARKLG